MACGFRVYVDRAMLLLSQRTMYLTKLSPTVSEISGQLLQPATTCYILLYPTHSTTFYSFYITLQTFLRRSCTACHALQPRFLTV